MFDSIKLYIYIDYLYITCIAVINGKLKIIK